MDLRIDYKGELNPQQFEAVNAPPGPALVIAGAGSGKTRTLVYRVAFLLEQGIPPERLLLLTFTNKAAQEMMRRVADLLGANLDTLWGGTFHSIGCRVLRRHAELVGRQPAFTILDREDSADLIKACVTSTGIKHAETDFPKPPVLSEIFSLASNKRLPAREIVFSEFPEIEHHAPGVQSLHTDYEKRKIETNSVDFDDLLLLWRQLLMEHSEIREHYQRRFQFILVDEYQDTNALQSEIIDTLAEKSQNVMVVGDDAQSIYSWRGADFRNILQFPDRYPKATVYRIETNYRSTPEILACANAVIAANTLQFPKALVSARHSGPKPIVAECETAFMQSNFVAQRVTELNAEGIPLSEMVVLYRSHFHALELQLELTKRKIPFSITSGMRFFEQAHIKDVTAYLKLLANPRDEVSFHRIAALLPGVGGKTAAKLWTSVSTHLQPSPEALGEPPRRPASPLATALASAASKAPAKAAAPWAALTATISQLESSGYRGSPSRMIRHILDSGYETVLQEHYDKYRSRRDDLAQLADFAGQFGNLDDLLTQLALLTNVEAESNAAANHSENGLRLSTIHQAKGLEFEVAFVIMLCEGLFPSARSLEEPSGAEEERRLFYVAVTRAKTHLHLSWVRFKASYGSDEYLQIPSRFLAEIPQDRLDVLNLNSYY